MKYATRKVIVQQLVPLEEGDNPDHLEDWEWERFGDSHNLEISEEPAIISDEEAEAIQDSWAICY